MESNTTTVTQLSEDLQREIFEIVARSNPRDAAMLLTVEKRVYHWIKPLLYAVIIDRLTFSSEDWYIEHGRDIHHLLIVGGHLEYIRHCPNLHNLAIWAVPSPEEMIYIETLRLVRLAVMPVHLFGSAAASQNRGRAQEPLFPYLTHLDLVNFWGGWGECSRIALLPRLTHLGLCGAQDSVVQGALDHCQHLRAIVIVSHSDAIPGDINVKQREGCEQGDDHRVVYVNVRRYDKNWEAGARGYLDTWSLADKIVEARIKR